jgi:hypothetical protein
MNLGEIAGSAAETGASAGSTASGGGNVGQIIEAIGKVVVGGVDASKRRKMDYNMSQQRLNAELGIAKDTAAQQLQLQKLSILANQGNQPAPSKGNTALYVGLGIGALALVGVIVYVVKK